MQILKIDKRTNFVHLKPENADDLWHIEKVIEVGDRISAKTMRKASISRGGEIERTEKRPVFLTIETEKIELDGTRLRITGPIVEGLDEHGYHSIDIEEQIPVGITKKREWRNYEIDRLKKATIPKSKILIVVMDRGECDFAVLGERLDFVEGVRKYMGGKQFPESLHNEFFGDSLAAMKRYEPKVERIILAGPGFAKDDFLKFVKEKDHNIYKKIRIETSSSTGLHGINEVIKRGAVESVVKENRISEETKLVEKLMTEIAKEGAVTYGKNHVVHAIELGAVESLIISDKKVKENEKIMDATEKQSGRVEIISTEHDMGIRFLNLGGIAAFLRYKIQD